MCTNESSKNELYYLLPVRYYQSPSSSSRTSRDFAYTLLPAKETNLGNRTRKWIQRHIMSARCATLVKLTSVRGELPGVVNRHHLTTPAI